MPAARGAAISIPWNLDWLLRGIKLSGVFKIGFGHSRWEGTVAKRWSLKHDWVIPQIMRNKALFTAAIFMAAIIQLVAGEPTGKVLAYGIFKPTEKELIKTPETPSGFTRMVDDTVMLVATTNRIPARLGVSFGIVYQISGLKMKDGDFAEVTYVTTCPRIKKPDGSTCESFTSVKKLRVQDGKAGAFSGYSFDLDYEMVPGLWKKEIQLNGKILVTQEFKVYKE